VLPDDLYREFNFSTGVVSKLWKRMFPLVYYEPLREDSDDLWGGDLSEDGWGGDIGNTQAEQKQVNAFISDSTFLARRVGFEAIKDVVIVIPEALLAEAAIEPKRGDKVSHGDMTFAVGELLPFGNWRKTSRYMYVAMNCRVL
jgi:hypothetical protein